MHRKDVGEVLAGCAKMYEGRAMEYSPDPDCPDEGLSLTVDFISDVYGRRHSSKNQTRYVLNPYASNDLALWTNVGQKIARLRTRGIPGYGDSDAVKKDFIDDAEDLIVFLAMGICMIKDTYGMAGFEAEEVGEEEKCGLTD